MINIKEKLLLELFKIIGIEEKNKKQLIGYYFHRDILLNKDVIKNYLLMVDILKKTYPSCKLTCLNSNSTSKQKFIAVNMLRQISRENKLDLEPIVKSNGYNPITKKKLVNRFYLIRNIENLKNRNNIYFILNINDLRKNICTIIIYFQG